MPKLSLRYTLIAVVFLLATTVVMLPQAFDPDMYWHIRSGDVMLDSGTFIIGDLFSHTKAGELRPHHEWLTEVLTAALYRQFSDYGITLMATVFSMVGLAWMFRLSRGNLALKLAMVLLVSNIVTTTAMGRPQGWSLVFSLFYVGFILGRDKRALPWIPVIMLLWINLHGGWITGYIILGAGVVSEVLMIFLRRGGEVAWLRQLVIWSALSLLVLPINPYGFDQVLVPLETFSLASRSYINEWRPPNLLEFNRISYVIMLVLTALVVLKYYRRITLTEAFLLGGFGIWSLTTTRIVLSYTFIAPIILTPYLSEWLEQLAPRLMLKEDALKRTIRLGVPLVAVFGVLVGFLFIAGSRPERIRRIQEVNYPVGAVEFIKENFPPHELFNSDRWGGYLIYYLPEYPVYIDTRSDLYDEFALTYLSVIRGEDGWEEILASQGVQTVLIPPTARLTEKITASSLWVRVYEDEVALVFQKTTTD